MQITKFTKRLLLVYLLPSLLYWFFTKSLIPELRTEFVAWVVFLFLSTSYFVSVFIIWKCVGQKQRKVFTLVSSVLVFLVHCAVFCVIFLQIHFKLFSSSRVVCKKEYTNQTIYVLHWYGLFQSYEGAEIGYSNNYSPFYIYYYSTKNNLEVVENNGDVFILKEYKYIDIDEDATMERAFYKTRPKERIELDTIQIDTKRLK